MSFRFGACLSLLAGLPLYSMAETIPDLLVPVGPGDTQRVAARNDYYVSLHTWFAKRHRIVRVNTDALFAQPMLRIPLFDDNAVLVQREHLQYRACRNMFTWDGRLLDLPIAPSDSHGQKLPDNQVEASHAALIGLQIVGSKYALDPARGRSISLASVDARSKVSSNGGSALSPVVEIFEISAEIAPPSEDAVYRIQPIESDRRYHLLVEIDPARSLSPGQLALGGAQDTDELARRRQQFQRFREALGPAPDTILRTEPRQ